VETSTSCVAFSKKRFIFFNRVAFKPEGPMLNWSGGGDVIKFYSLVLYCQFHCYWVDFCLWVHVDTNQYIGFIIVMAVLSKNRRAFVLCGPHLLLTSVSQYFKYDVQCTIGRYCQFNSKCSRLGDQEKNMEKNMYLLFVACCLLHFSLKGVFCLSCCRA
jgi:hypothetical protein